MEKIKCECGHMNPHGTVLCEACGKPVEGNQSIDGNDKRVLLNMRYEGSARRSQTYSQSLVDKTWNFFSSVKVGVSLIAIALVASIIGTIFPQRLHIPIEAPSRDPAVFYEAQYGIIGKIYYQLGFYDLYSSWWYMIVIALIGVSIVIASIDRFVPLRRALKMQRPKRNKTFLSRQRLYSESVDIQSDETAQVREKLGKMRYNIREDNGHVFAEKGRFSRWGPYVNHIGLIIILIAALLRTTPMFYLDEYLWVREGQQLTIPGTENEFQLENKEFIFETYGQAEEDLKFKEAIEKQDELIAKNYQTNAVIYQANEEALAGEDDALEVYKEAEIRMNEPAKFGGYTIYQSGYQEEYSSMTFKLHEIDDPDEEEIGTITIDLLDTPETTFTFDNGYAVEVSRYYPEMHLVDGVPKTKSNYPRNPAFVFIVYPPDNGEPEISFAGIGINFDPNTESGDSESENKHKLSIVDLDNRYVSGLSIRRDYTLPLFGLGALIFMIGVTQGMYWQHRRIWLHPSEEGTLLVGAHTNKNWYGVKKDIEKAIEGTSIVMVHDQQELEDALEEKEKKMDEEK